MAGPNCCAQAFFYGGGPGGVGGAEAGVGELLADRDEFGGQAAEALEGVDLGLDGGDGRRRHGAGGALALDVACEHVVGAVAGMVLGVAAAGGLAAFHEAMDEGAGAHVAEGGECGEDAVAALLEGRDVGSLGGRWHGASCL